MNAQLLAYTQPNPALTPESAAAVSDLAALWQGKGAYAENMVEYAGRVCYRSTQRMGSAPDFISARVREGHEDIIEHVVVSVRFTDASDEPLRWRLANRHCEVTDLGSGSWIVSGNLRVWLDLFRRGIGAAAVPLVRSVAPAVFTDLGSAEDAPTAGSATIDLRDPLPAETVAALASQSDGQMRVTLLGFSQPRLPDPGLLLHHGAATFLFEGISRACTHQMVRHRLGSFSQESQRYVDLSKGGWNPVVPAAFADLPGARAVLDEFWALAENKYAQLRKLGVRKEDARFLLPNAAETRIVATMNFAGWSHFLWLRAVDKAAQWEIRALGQRALGMLHALAPEVFAEHWRVYREQFAGGQDDRVTR
jgi:thymidylate synthase (FAD)